MECPTATKNSDCTVFTPDTNNDGYIDETDEGVTLNGSVGFRGYKNLAPGGPFHYIDVLTPPSSGTASVTLMGTPK
jgi:hypothetical protein